MLTPIHRALGLTPGAFDRALIEQAVTGEVAEGTDLDWKRSAPALKADPDREEFAKDVAAMANSGGGWIVYGIAEKQGEANTADSVTPVIWGTDHEQKFRQVAYALVAPPVAGLEFHPVPWDDGGYVVGMRVPASLDVPHFASFRQDGFRAPRRDGAHTQYMDTRQIEDAFRRRFQGRADQQRALDDAYALTRDSAPVTQGVCLVVAAVPITPGMARSPLGVDEARTFMCHPGHEGIARLGEPNSMLSVWEWGDVRKGLRGWGLRIPHEARYPFGKWIGEDGSVRAYYQLGGFDWGTHDSYQELNENPGHCMSRHIEWAMADVAAMVRSLANHREVHDGYQIRVGLEWEGSPIAIRTTYHGDYLLPESETTPIHRFLPVRFEYDPLAPRSDWLPVVRQATKDVVNQGGVQYLRVMESVEGD